MVLLYKWLIDESSKLSLSTTKVLFRTVFTRMIKVNLLLKHFGVKYDKCGIFANPGGPSKIYKSLYVAHLAYFWHKRNFVFHHLIKRGTKSTLSQPTQHFDLCDQPVCHNCISLNRLSGFSLGSDGTKPALAHWVRCLLLLGKRVEVCQVS